MSPTTLSCRLVGLCLSLSAAASAGIAQQAVRSHDTGAAVPIHTAAPDSGVDYGVWAAGERYKVSFHDGATFVPLLGRDYPHNQPWSWHTSSVRLGEVELVTQAPELGYGEWRAEYALGGVVEAYDVREDGVEQTFVIPTRAAAGDLVVRGTVTSLLRAASTAPAHRGLSFCDAQGRELVTYGAATAVDARGDRRAMTTGYADGAITLRLDAAWLATATFPVVVDPLLGPGQQVGGNTRYEVDIARDTETNLQPNWVAYSAFASATDADLYLRRFEDNGNLASTAFTDLTSSWSTRRPAVAFNSFANHAAVAFDRFFPTQNTIRVRVHRHLRSDTTSNTSYDAVPSADNAWRADLGGTRRFNAGPDLMLVYQQEPNGGGNFQNASGSDIYAVTYDSSAGSFGAPFGVATSIFNDHERPSINQVSLDNNANPEWSVAYQYLTNVISNDDLDVAVCRVDVAGNVSATTTIDAGFNGHQWAPKIAGAGNRYLCTFVAKPQTILVPTGINGRQLRSVRIDWSATSALEPHGTVVLQSNSDDRLELGGLAFDRNTISHWAVLFRSNVTGNLYLRTVGYRGRQLQAETVFAAGSGEDGVLGGLSFDESADAFPIAYAYNQTSATDYVRTDRFVYPAALPPSTAGTGCSAANIEWYGSQQIGSQFSGLRVTGAANDSIHIAVLATAPASAVLFNVPPIQNGCWLLVPNTGADFLGVFGVKVGGTVSWNLPLLEGLGTDTYYMQGWHTIGNGNFDFVSTQRLAVPTVK